MLSLNAFSLKPIGSQHKVSGPLDGPVTGEYHLKTREFNEYFTSFVSHEPYLKHKNGSPRIITHVTSEWNGENIFDDFSDPRSGGRVVQRVRHAALGSLVRGSIPLPQVGLLHGGDSRRESHQDHSSFS